MNDALDFYSENNRVGCIHAWNYSLHYVNGDKNTFFLKGADCWGWATWSRAWQLFNQNGEELLNLIRANDEGYEFDRRGTHPFLSMLEDQVKGKNDSWAIRWHASLFLAGMFCLQPTKPIVINIGLDGSGVHCGYIELAQHTVESIKVSGIPIEESEWFFIAYSEAIKKNINLKGWQKLKEYLKASFRRF